MFHENRQGKFALRGLVGWKIFFVVFKKLITLLFLAAVGFAVWKFFFSAKPAEADPVVILSGIIDSHVIQILGPLDSNTVPVDSHVVRKLREDLRDGASNGRREVAELHAAGVRLCDTLLIILEERESHSLRVRHIVSNTGLSELSEYPEEDRRRRVEFFVSGVERSWVEKVRAFRKKIDADYKELRRLERSANS
jgi:hypothetical protein